MTAFKFFNFTARVLIAVAVIGFFAAVAHAVAPLAGSTIGNQATATYTDASNTPHTATSNVTLTVVQQVASLTLSSDQSKAAAPGGQAVFPHTLTNTGNGADTFALTLTQSSADNFDLTSAAIYADANGDGLPDNSTAITSTGLIAAGAKFQFVVVGTIPGSQTTSQTSQSTVTATSTFTPATNAANTDTVTVSSNAVIRVTQSLSSSSGASPSGPYTYTLTFSNTGNVSATALTLTDSLPTGMTYVAGSARWSASGTTALTDAAAGDPAGIAYDYGITAAGRITAVISTLTAGQSGTLTFQASVPTATAPGNLANTAAYTYNDSSSVVGPYNSNTVIFTVTQPSSVSVTTGSPVASAQQGGTVSFTNVVTNTGYGTETFELTTASSTFPAGTTFRLVRSDGTTSILDSNANGTPDTGPLAPTGTFTVIVLATLPSGSTGGPYSVNLVATAATDASITGSATDTLTTISTSTVDITADVGATLGVGAGLDATAIATLTGDPTSTVRFTLNVKNNSTVADVYNLDASSLFDFSVAGLPTGWTVVFKDAAEAIVTKTAIINAGANQILYADVTIPAGRAPGTQAVYFRALSPTTASFDRIHDAVTVNTVRRLSITPNNAGQIFPGGAVVYSHTLINTGNVLEGDNLVSTIALTTTNNISGWSSIVYYDANGNGALDAGEVAVTDLSFVSASAAGLAPGESVKLLVKVFAPSSATLGAADATTLVVTTTNGSYTTTVPVVGSATETSTVILGELKLVKEQALDANSDGAPDTAYATATITTGAAPGVCVRYRVTVTNIGAQDALSVVVNDVTPTFTTYHSLVPAATTVGSVGSTPANGAAGALTFNIGTLAPGASAVVTFGVKINQ